MVTIGIDGGNGFTHAAMVKKKKLRMYSVASLRRPVRGGSVDLSGMQMEYDYVDWGDARYTFGDDTLKFDDSRLSSHRGFYRYGDEFHLFLTSLAVSKLGVKGGKVDLGIVIPPGLYRSKREELKEKIGNSDYPIRLKGDKRYRAWEYNSVSVYAEGVAAVAALLFDDSGKPQKRDLVHDLLAGDILVIDPGVYTLDTIRLHDGRVATDEFDYSSLQNQGISAHIRTPLLRRLRAQNIVGLSEYDIDVALRNGGGVMVLGDLYDTTHIIDELSYQYARWIADNVIENLYQGLQRIRRVLVVGGVANFVLPYLKKLYSSDKFVDLSSYTDTHPAALNSLGALRLKTRELSSGE